MTQSDTFELLEPSEFKKLTTTARSKEIDKAAAEKLANIPLGRAFKINRPEHETVRQFKKRLNQAAASSGRTLNWTTLSKNVPEGEEATEFVAKVVAVTPTSNNGSAPAQSEPEASAEQKPANRR